MTERFSLFKRVTAVFRRMGLRARIMWAMGTVSAVILSACFAGLVSGIPFVERSLLSDGLYYVNKLRAARGVAALPALTQENLQYEYIRELYSEGQIFFMYKRMFSRILRSVNEKENPQPSDALFVVPLPDSETEN